MSPDFLPLFFFFKQLLLAPVCKPSDDFDFFRIFAEIFDFSGASPVSVTPAKQTILRGVLENKLNCIYNLITIWLRDLIVSDNFSIGPLKIQKYWWRLSKWWGNVVTSICLLSNRLTPTMMRDLVLLVRKWSHSCFFVVLDKCTSTSIWYGGKKIFLGSRRL